MLAKAIAKHTSAMFVNITPSMLMSKWYGESQKMVVLGGDADADSCPQIKAMFTFSWKVQPVVIFIDEIDAFLRTRSGGDHEVRLFACPSL